MTALTLLRAEQLVRDGEMRYGDAIIRFADDVWPLTDYMNNPLFSPAITRVDFSNVDGWLRHDAKAWIAHLWLDRGRGPNTIRQNLNTVLQIGRALRATNFAGPTFAMGRSEALIVQRDIFDASQFARGTMDARRGLANAFAAHLRKSYPDAPQLDQFVIRQDKDAPPKTVGKAFGLETAKVISVDTRIQLLAACRADEEEYEAMAELVQARKPLPRRGLRLATFLARAMKAQALKVALATGRRAGSICELPVQPQLERSTDPEAPGVMLRYHEAKITDAPHEAFAPHEYGDLLIDAVDRAQRYGAALRADDPRLSGYLFVLPGALGREAVVLLKTSIMNEYLRYPKYTPEGVVDIGLLARYGITGVEGDLAEITSHNFRHTRATALFAGSGESQVVSQDLGHVNLDMAVRHYIGVTAEVREAFDREVQAGAVRVSGANVVDSAEIVDEHLLPSMALQKSRRLMVLQPTRFGFCSYPAAQGPCPTANPCYVGIDAERPDVADGCGCEHQVLAPHAADALREDEAVLLQQVATYSASPDSRSLAQHFRLQLQIVQKQLLDIDTSLVPKLRAFCGGSC